MSESPYRPVFDDVSGEMIGVDFTAADGNDYRATLDGEIVAAEIDGELYEVPEGTLWIDDGEADGADEPAYAELSPEAVARLEAVEQKVEQQQPNTYLLEQPQELSEAEITAAWNFQRGYINDIAGRKLTTREWQMICDEDAASIQAGNEPDLVSAMERCADRGKHFWNLDSDHPGVAAQERAGYTAELIHEAEHADAGHGPLDAAPATREEYDIDDGAQRRQWMTDMVSGKDMTGTEAYYGAEPGDADLAAASSDNSDPGWED